MHRFAILKKDNPEILVACLGNFAPQPYSTIILGYSSTWISYNLSNPLILNSATVTERAPELEVFSDFHLMLLRAVSMG